MRQIRRNNTAGIIKPAYFAPIPAKYEKKIEKARQKLIDAVNDN